MELSELLIIHLSTLLIIVVGGLFSIKFWRYWKEKTLGSLFFFFFTVTLLYTFTLILRFPTPEVNLVQWTGAGIPYALFLTQGFVPYFASIFSISMLQPKHAKLWKSLLALLIGVYIIILSLYRPIWKEVRPGVWEWVLAEIVANWNYVSIAMAFIPASLFLLTLVKSKGRSERASNCFLFVGFLGIALLVMISESYGAFPPIGARRILVALALILLYSGFTMPTWIRRAIRL
jgi:hypothetical protein